MSDNTLANPPINTPKSTVIAIFIFALIVVVLLALGCDWHQERASHVWISLLFGTPCALQLIGLCVLRKQTTAAFWRFNWLATLLCQVSYCSLWLVYSTVWRTSQRWSLAALALTFLMLLFVGIMTFAIMGKRDEQQTEVEDVQEKETDNGQPDGLKPSERKPNVSLWNKFYHWWETFSHDLSIGVGQHPFWAIMFFMALFLGVSYMFGFALAFHDQATLKMNPEKPALHMVNLKSIDDNDMQQATNSLDKGNRTITADGDQTAGGTTSQSGANTASPSGEKYHFFFDVVHANVYGGNQCNTDTNPKPSDPYPSKPGDFNECSLKFIVTRLQEELNPKEGSKGGSHVKVNLLGHTDNEPIKIDKDTPVRYLSNYELSEARAQNVQYAILQRLQAEHTPNLENIDWTIFPAADEALPQIDSALPPNLDSHAHAQWERVVIATLEKIDQHPVVLRKDQFKTLSDGQGQTNEKLDDLDKAQKEQRKPKPLRLMDYMYFSIYTITTTGYGDIIPTTAYAKFVTSVANIFEVIFLVVFFNALISLKESQKVGSQRARAKSGQKEEAVNKDGQALQAQVAINRKM